MTKTLRRFAAVLTAALLTFQITAPAAVDDASAYETPRAVYAGRADGAAVSASLRFLGAENHWARESIVRAGALGLIKGREAADPDAFVSNGEALAVALRLMGREAEAATAAAALPGGLSVGEAWPLGYLETAKSAGLITAEEYDAALNTGGFSVSEGVTRERAAGWFVKAAISKNAAAFPVIDRVTAIMNYGDYRDIAAEFAESVEILTQNRVISGSGGLFRPKAGMSWGEMARMAANMEKFWLSGAGLSKKTGTVAVRYDSQHRTADGGTAWRDILVRTEDGGVEAFRFEPPLDAVVYKNGAASGLSALSDGDEIEYITNGAGELLYANALKGLTESEVSGFLREILTDGPTVSISDVDGKNYIYSMAEGMLANGRLLVEGKWRSVDDLPQGSRCSLTLTNGVVTALRYVGEPRVVSEVRGVVTENNPQFGYMTVITADGEITKQYYEGNLSVLKLRHYDEDRIGYIAVMFPYFKYNPRDADISEIEPGDVVFLRVNGEDMIESVSAAADYTVKYGKIKQIAPSGAGYGFLLEYEDGRTASLNAAAGVFVSKGGKPARLDGIMPGDWAKVLVAEAALGAGKSIESVKEINIEGGGHMIADIVKGELSGINPLQNENVLADSYSLAKTGWSDYKPLKSLQLRDAEFYQNGARVSLDAARRFWARSGASVYIAVSDSYDGGGAAKVTLFDSRDEPLPAATVQSADGTGAFSLYARAGTIEARDGAIVRRYGRLVDPSSVMPSDFARVILNGDGQAAVVDITDDPSAAFTLTVARGRVQSARDGQSFAVKSMSVLNGREWAYTPVQREFAIDRGTIFSGADGNLSIETFIGYTDDSVIDGAFTIIADGSRAAAVIDAPYCEEAARGVIYRLDESSISLKDASVWDESAGRWTRISDKNAVISVEIPQNAVILKNNAITGQSGLEIGDQVLVMTDSINKPVQPNDSVTGYIITAER